ncbi:G-type lectin S-receptor-like serine/threonine-protein kinase [Trichoplax sp. H2]|nr:G-type lectin S-receptor-like serine/threonine-protein kinase [Trichoplax sp. H2]|eukprot:RDD38108.1 G-type lectin S-receptor-like serine/threonine-protein kinase [Trichoplax sp. H2]
MVMEFIANGSLNSRLQAKDEILNYWVRIQICIGVAKGINYLHTAFRTYLVHRDIKTDNILLTEDYTPKICDFGLSKILSTRTDRDSTAITENIIGTRAYLPPEAYQKIISRRFDVYCYGVVLLEIISGKSAFFSDKEGYRYLAGYFHYCYKHCKSKFPIDENANWPDDFVKRLTKLAKWCLMDNYKDRPYMDKIIANLIRIASKA